MVLKKDQSTYAGNIAPGIMEFPTQIVSEGIRLVGLTRWRRYNTAARYIRLDQKKISEDCSLLLDCSARRLTIRDHPSLKNIKLVVFSGVW